MAFAQLTYRENLQYILGLLASVLATRSHLLVKIGVEIGLFKTDSKRKVAIFKFPADNGFLRGGMLRSCNLLFFVDNGFPRHCKFPSNVQLLAFA